MNNIREKPKFVIDFNKKLALFYDKTIYYNEGNEVELNEDPKNFIPTSCFLNYNEDALEFMIKIHYAKLQNLRIGKKTVSYKLGNLQPVAIPLSSSEKSRDNGSEICTIKIIANIKDRLLHLFEYNQKVFTLKIFYSTTGDKKYATTFTVTLPKIDKQTDWDPKKRFIKVYNPEDIGGFELKKLFESHFSRHEVVSQKEHAILNDLWDYREASFDDKFKRFNFLKMFQYMEAIEDLDSYKEMKEFALDMIYIYKYSLCPSILQNTANEHLRHIMCKDKHCDLVQRAFIIQARRKLPVDVMEFDSIFFTDQLDYQENHDDPEELANLRKVGKILYIFGDIIIFVLPRVKGKKQQVKIDNMRLYHVDFVPNRIATRVTHRALEDMLKMKMGSFLRNFEKDNLRKDEKEYFHTFEWFNSTLTDNEEQQLAVEKIVNCTSFPSPFIIFGGPGTGKSSTIVEAIAQIAKLKPKSFVLVAAGSNSACDDIGNRLLKFISINKILRIYSPSFNTKPEKIHDVLQKISNFRKRTGCNCGKRSCPDLDGHSDPSYEELYTARIVIVTLITAGRLISAGIDSDHFDYIFIDEAGCVSESHTYVPISGLGLSNKGISAQIVLSGDHKQLGPIVKNRFAQKMGMETSLMQRLMDTDEKYQRFENEYDHDFVVQLKNNYRNHPAIMHFSNVNFYNEQLKSMCSEEIKLFALDPTVLLFNSNFPILFHTIRTRSIEVGVSLKNEGEKMILRNYLEVILSNGLASNKVEEDDIGIISPYRGQRDSLVEELSDVYPKVEIGTVDSFQGREKKIIIMSCVRSGTSHVGFLRNEKRLNVALTRAQSLLIIIGNAETLQKCSIWNKFITYCYDNQAMIGDHLSINHEAIGSDNMAGSEVLPADGVEDEYEE